MMTDRTFAVMVLHQEGSSLQVKCEIYSNVDSRSFISESEVDVPDKCEVKSVCCECELVRAFAASTQSAPAGAQDCQCQPSTCHLVLNNRFADPSTCQNPKQEA
jgi:hypothetical protein